MTEQQKQLLENCEDELFEKLARFAQYFKYVEAYENDDDKKKMLKAKYEIKSFVQSLLCLQEAKTREECAGIITPISKKTNKPIILSEHIETCSVCKRNEDCLTEIVVSALETAKQKILAGKQK